MNRLRNVLLRRCKSLSRSRSRSSSSYSNLRSMSARDIAADADEAIGAHEEAAASAAVVFVGSSRRRYVISAKHLSHPLIAALIDTTTGDGGGCSEEPVAVKCEVVLFDHLLWMLDNAADLREDDGGDAARELAQLYETC